jgi:hypothetical protein
MVGASPHIPVMWTRFAFAGLAAALASPAAAQCLSIPDGTGNTVLHCQDGRTGVQHTDPGGATSGLLGGETLTAPLDPLPAGARALAVYVNPSLAVRPAPSLAPPAIEAAAPARPFSTYPDPAGAGMRSQPGESPPARDPSTTSGATP